MKALTTKVPSDLMDRVDDRAEQRDITRSHAARDLIYAGLDATDDDDTDWRGRLATAVAILFVTGYPTLAAHTGNLRVAIIFILAGATYALFQPQIDTTLDRLPNPLNRLRNP